MIFCLLFTDLFACEFSQFGPNNSITTDGEVSVGSKNKRKSQNQTLLCSTSSSSDTYLEIKLKHFYDVCAVSVWTNTPSFNLTNFKIQYLNYGKFWEYYEEMGQVKVSNIHTFCLSKTTTKLQ